MRVKKIVTIVVACTMLLSLNACSKEKVQETEKQVETETKDSDEGVKKEIETAVGEFQYACQTSDVDAMLDCLDSGFAQSLKSGRLLLNWMSTDDNADEIIMNTLVISIMNIADISVDLSTMNIETDEIEVKENMATVKGTLEMESTDGTYHDDISIRMAKDSDKWYITGVAN